MVQNSKAKSKQSSKGFAASMMLLMAASLVILEFQNGPQRLLRNYKLAAELESNQLLQPHKNRTIVYLNSIDSNPPTIYVCQGDGNGIGEAKAVLKSILPEFTTVQDMSQVGAGARPGLDAKKWFNIPGNEYDLFLIPLGLSCSAVVNNWIMTTFAGKLVQISGESNTDFGRPHDFRYVLGPVPGEAYHQFPLTYLQMVWWGVYRETWGDQVLQDLAHKPKNNGTHFLVYSASNCVPFRDQAFDELSTLGHVHYGGRCKGNTNLTNKTYYENNVSLRNWWDNVNTYKPFRFCLVMEHANQLGYMTEKILMAFLAGCIPVYYGSPQILDVFNPQAFVYYNVSNPGPALEKIRFLETNRTEYAQVLNHKPILLDGAMEQFFSFSDDVGGGLLKRQIREFLGMDQFQFELPGSIAA